MERYESLGPVGEGSYGTVLKCRHRDSGRLVAIKKFMDSDDDKTVKKIALREIKLLRQLRHDNLVNLLEVWKRRRRWYLVFEFVDRTLLDELEQNSSGLDLNTCRQYLFQILRATNFCHQQDVIHRDIKPENILISQEGVVKLCDFGFARTLASPSEGGVYTDYVATRWYRAPELLVGDIKYGKPVDVWALGCLLIEMLTAQPLFPGDSDLDQVYHIVRCFGNLTAHHQELFYRNPIFSGVKLPEFTKTVPLQQRFPTVPPTALDLAQRCLEMDPKRRAPCSDLLDHLLFTQDSFNISFLDELNTKIPKDHRENSTFPKIPKTTLQEKEKGDKNCRGKDKKQLEETDEKVNQEKMEKPKGKQTSKQFKSVHTTTESFITKQPKTFGNKGIYHTEQFSMKPEKTAELKEFEILKSTKISISDSLDVTKKAVNVKKKSLVATEPKHEQDVSPNPRRDHLPNTKGVDYSNPDREKTTMLSRESSKSETSKEFMRSLSNPSLKVSKLSKISITDAQSLNPSPKTVLESDTGVAPPYTSLTLNDHTTSTLLTKSGKTSLASKQIDILEADNSECPKLQAINLKKSQSTSTAVQHSHNTSSSPSRAVEGRSKPSFMAAAESSAAHNPSVLPRGISLPKTTCTAKTPTKDKIPTEDRGVRKYQKCLKLNPMTETPSKLSRSFHVLDRDPQSSEPYFACRQRNMIGAEDRFNSTSVPDENLPMEKPQTVSAKDNLQDLVFSVPANALIHQPRQAPERSDNEKRHSSNQEFKLDSRSLNIPHNQNPTTPQSFTDHMMSLVNSKTQKSTFTPDTRKRCNKLEGNGTNMSTDLTSFMSVDRKVLTRSLILHKTNSEFDCSVLRSCTSSPPPTPATNRLHLPPSSKTLTPSIVVSSANWPAASDHSLQGGVPTGTNNAHRLDKPRPHGGVQSQQDRPFGLNHASRSFTSQASENSFASEGAKNRAHFPDVRSSALPELSGKEAKHNKGATREEKTEKAAASPSPPSEGQYGQTVNTNTANE